MYLDDLDSPPEKMFDLTHPNKPKMKHKQNKVVRTASSSGSLRLARNLQIKAN